MNAPMFRDPPNQQDEKFRAFCEKHHICLPKNYPTQKTFHHHNGSSEATLDYILEIGGAPCCQILL